MPVRSRDSSMPRVRCPLPSSGDNITAEENSGANHFEPTPRRGECRIVSIFERDLALGGTMPKTAT